MERAELEQLVIECVATSYKRDASELSLETSFKQDLKGASIQMVALSSLIENETDALVMLPTIASCATIGDLVDKVEAEL